jgi:putative transposase
MVRYIDDYRDRFGVEPICRVLPIAPSTYYEMKARQRDPERLPPRAIRDEQLMSFFAVMEPAVFGVMEPLFVADFQARTGTLFS